MGCVNGKQASDQQALHKSPSRDVPPPASETKRVAVSSSAEVESPRTTGGMKREIDERVGCHKRVRG